VILIFGTQFILVKTFKQQYECIRRKWKQNIGIFICPIEGFHRSLALELVSVLKFADNDFLKDINSSTSHPLVKGPSCFTWLIQFKEQFVKFCYSQSKLSLQAHQKFIPYTICDDILSAFSDMPSETGFYNLRDRGLATEILQEYSSTCLTFIHKHTLKNDHLFHDMFSDAPDSKSLSMLDDMVRNFTIELTRSEYTIIQSGMNIRYNNQTQRVPRRFRLLFTIIYFDTPAFFKDCNTIVSSLRQSMPFFRRNDHHSQEEMLEVTLSYVIHISSLLDLNSYFSKIMTTRDGRNIGKRSLKHVVIMNLLHQFISFCSSQSLSEINTYTESTRLNEIQFEPERNVHDNDIESYPSHIQLLCIIKHFLACTKTTLKPISINIGASRQHDWFTFTHISPDLFPFAYDELNSTNQNVFDYLFYGLRNGILSFPSTNYPLIQMNNESDNVSSSQEILVMNNYDASGPSSHKDIDPTLPSFQGRKSTEYLITNHPLSTTKTSLVSALAPLEDTIASTHVEPTIPMNNEYNKDLNNVLLSKKNSSVNDGVVCVVGPRTDVSFPITNSNPVADTVTNKLFSHMISTSDSTIDSEPDATAPSLHDQTDNIPPTDGMISLNESNHKSPTATTIHEPKDHVSPLDGKISFMESNDMTSTYRRKRKRRKSHKSLNLSPKRRKTAMKQKLPDLSDSSIDEPTVYTLSQLSTDIRSNTDYPFLLRNWKVIKKQLIKKKSKPKDSNVKGLINCFSSLIIRVANQSGSYRPCHCVIGSSCLDDTCESFEARIECTPGTCSAGTSCQNNRTLKGLGKKVTAFSTSLKGLGLRLQESARKGDFIIEYIGTRAQQEDKGEYCLQITRELKVNAEINGNDSKYINHSHEPNCQIQQWTVQSNKRAAVMALVDIAQGTELTVDYGWTYSDENVPKTVCQCGASTCTGYIERKK